MIISRCCCRDDKKGKRKLNIGWVLPFFCPGTQASSSLARSSPRSPLYWQCGSNLLHGDVRSSWPLHNVCFGRGARHDTILLLLRLQLHIFQHALACYWNIALGFNLLVPRYYTRHVSKLTGQMRLHGPSMTHFANGPQESSAKMQSQSDPYRLT